MALDLTKPCRIHVPDAETSERVQRELIKLGCWWRRSKSGPEYTDKPYLFVNESLQLDHTEIETYFRKHAYREIFLHDIFPDDKTHLFRNTKIKVPTEEDSKRIQELAFQHGCIWTGETVATYDSRPLGFMFFSPKKGTITYEHHSKKDYFDEHPHREVTLEEMFPPEPVKQSWLQVPETPPEEGHLYWFGNPATGFVNMGTYDPLLNQWTMFGNDRTFPSKTYTHYQPARQPVLDAHGTKVRP
jgi:hypothetical protein